MRHCGRLAFLLNYVPIWPYPRRIPAGHGLYPVRWHASHHPGLCRHRRRRRPSSTQRHGSLPACRRWSSRRHDCGLAARPGADSSVPLVAAVKIVATHAGALAGYPARQRVVTTLVVGQRKTERASAATTDRWQSVVTTLVVGRRPAKRRAAEAATTNRWQSVVTTLVVGRQPAKRSADSRHYGSLATA